MRNVLDWIFHAFNIVLRTRRTVGFLVVVITTSGFGLEERLVAGLGFKSPKSNGSAFPNAPVFVVSAKSIPFSGNATGSLRSPWSRFFDGLLSTSE